VRLTLVISSLEAGGAERVLSTLANDWTGRGHEVTVVTDAPRTTDHYVLDSRVRRITLDTPSNSSSLYDKFARNFVRLKRLRSTLLHTSPDAVVAFGNTVNVRAVLAGVRLGVPTLISERTDPRLSPLPWPWRVLRRFSYPMADILVVQTRSVGEWAGRWLDGSSVRIIPNPVCVPKRTAPRPAALGVRPTLAAVGRMGPEKGFDMLLPAFAETGLASSGWQLVILGDGQERAALEAQAEALGLRHDVVMPGVVTDPQQWLFHADIFALSSRFEGFPNALLEAMACGLPVAAFDCPSGPGEIVRHEETGLLVPPGDTKALAAVITRLANDADLRRRLGSAAASDVTARYSPEHISSLWEEILTGLKA